MKSAEESMQILEAFDLTGSFVPLPTWRGFRTEIDAFPITCCTDCKEELRSSWSGRCLRCHEARLLPPEQWGWDGTPWDADDPTVSPGINPAVTEPSAPHPRLSGLPLSAVAAHRKPIIITVGPEARCPAAWCCSG